MDPSRVGLNAKTSADFLSAAGVQAAYLQLSSVVLQGAAIIGGKANSSAATAALYLSLVKSLAAEVVRVQPAVGSARRRLLATTLALTDATTIASILTSASASAVASGAVPAASAPTAASISAVATAVASLNTAIAAVTAGGLTSSTAFLNAITALNNIAYVSSTTLLASVSALASGTLSLADFNTATSATALATLIASTDVRTINAALYCAYLTSATNDAGVTTSNSYSTLCLPATSSSASAPAEDRF